MKKKYDTTTQDGRNLFYKEVLIPKLRKLAKKLQLDFYHYETCPNTNYHAYFCFRPRSTGKTDESIYFEFQSSDFHALEYGVTKDTNHGNWGAPALSGYNNFKDMESKDFIKNVKKAIKEHIRKFF
ncbi:MAG: hypothetical protein KBT11_03670 [Treponema sp.]|nr:hypothetical protein [Candidatus Treponema equifaecale]